MQNTKTTYRDAGVNIEAANQFVTNIKTLAESTHNADVLGTLGGFAGLYQLPSGYQEPVLVSATDGVGTKLCLAIEANIHEGIGIDLVAMCVNDLICCGATPLYFLDYYATGRLNQHQGQALLRGITNGCKQANTALIGGETAEMPSVYAEDHYDLAGFAVGIIEKSAIITGQNVQTGMHVIGLASSGCHANGYSLVRKLIQDHQVDLSQQIAGDTLINQLLKPTQIYVQAVQTILSEYNIHAMAHITGGGFQENIPRVLPNHCAVKCSDWPIPEVFQFLQSLSQLSQAEMMQTFNMGIGFVMIVEADQSATILQALSPYHPAYLIGEVIERKQHAVEF